MRESSLPWLVIIVVAVVAVHDAEGSLFAADFQHHAVLDQRGAVIMMWTPTDDSVRVELQVATKGWVGLGFSPNGGMRGADITLGWVDFHGKLHVHDRYAHGTTTPVIDHSQDVVVEGGYQNDTHTVIRFSRPWNTCDTKHDFKLSDDTMRVIWAYGEEDPVDEMTMERHVERGTKSIYLKEPRFIQPQATEDIRTWDIRAPNVRLPSHTDTLYWCKLYKIPNFPSKVHVIGFKPLISRENNPFVHHILVFSCTGSPAHLEKWAQHDGVQCFSPNMPPSWSSCHSIIVAWAVGNDGEMWPEHVGMPLGDGSGNSYVMVEMHYDNPQLREGIVDDSGLRVFYTEKLRHYEAGNLMVGHSVTPHMIVPPRQNWKTIGHCSNICTEMAFPAEGVKVFQVFLHAHLLGRGLTVRHIRGNRELPILSQDLNYDFNYQQGRILPKEVTILPGDSLIVECQYDARERTVPTFGGESTSEEMCLAFLMYYPRVTMIGCRSSPLLEDIYRPLGVKDVYKQNMSARWRAFDEERERELVAALLERKEEPVVKEMDFGAAFKKMSVLEPASLKNKTLYDIIHDEATWRDKRKVKELQKSIEYSSHLTSCEDTSGIPNRSKQQVHKYPHFITINTVDEECSGTHESQAYLPAHPDSGRQGPLSLGLRPALTLSSLLGPLLLLIFQQ